MIMYMCIHKYMNINKIMYLYIYIRKYIRYFIYITNINLLINNK